MSRKPRTDSSVEGELYEDGPLTPEGLLARKQNARSMNPFGMGMVRAFGCTDTAFLLVVRQVLVHLRSGIVRLYLFSTCVRSVLGIC